MGFARFSFIANLNRDSRMPFIVFDALRTGFDIGYPWSQTEENAAKYFGEVPNNRGAASVRSKSVPQQRWPRHIP